MSRTASLKSAQYSGFGGGGVWDLENGGNLKTKRQPENRRQPENSAKPTGNVISCAVRYATPAQAGILVASQQRVVFSTITACAGIA